MASYQKTDSGKWQAIVRVKGPDGDVVLRKKTFPRKFEAREWAEKLEKAIRRGKVQAGAEARVDDLIQSYRRRRLEKLKKPVYRRRREKMLQWWSERLGKMRAREVSRAQVARCLDALDVASATRNRYKSALGAVYRFAIDRGEIARGENPTTGLHERENNARTRWLDEEERQKIVDAVSDDPDLRLYVAIAMSTGMRVGEIRMLRWRDCDFDRMLFRIVDTKSGHPRSAPIHETVRDLLIDRRAEQDPPSEWLFPGRCKPFFPRKRWERAVKKAGLEDFRFHDLRHTAASLLAQRGATLNELATLLGHETLAMVTRYAHMVDSQVADAARARLADLRI